MPWSLPPLLQGKLSNTWSQFLDLLANSFLPFTADKIIEVSNRNIHNNVFESWELVLSVLGEEEAVEIDGELKLLPVFLSLPPILQLRLIFCVQSNLSRISGKFVLSFLDKIGKSENSFWVKDAVGQLRTVVTQSSAESGQIIGEKTTKYEFTSESQKALQEMLCRLREGRRWSWLQCPGSHKLTTVRYAVTEDEIISVTKITFPSLPGPSDLSLDTIIIDDDSEDNTTTISDHPPTLTVRPDTISIQKDKFGNWDMAKSAGKESSKTSNKECTTELTTAVQNKQSLVNFERLSVVSDVSEFDGKLKDRKRKFSEIIEASDLTKKPVPDRSELVSARIEIEPGNIVEGDRSTEQVKPLFEPADSKIKLTGNTLICLDSIRESFSSNTSIIQDVMDCFLEMDVTEIEMACTYLSLPTLSVKALVNFCDVMPWASLGIDNSMILLDSCFRRKLTNLEAQASHMLMMSLGSVSRIQPKALINVLVHIVQGTQSSESQCRLLASFCKDFLFSDSHGYLIRKLSVEDLVLNEHLVGVLQTLLDKHSDLDVDAVTYFHALIKTASQEVSSSPKFGKLLMGFLTKYIKKMSSQQLITISTLVETHNTSFRKPLLAIIKRFT